MKMTPVGKLMAEFPLEPNHGKTLLSSAQFQCSSEMLTIIAMLSVPQVFHRGKDKEKQDAEAAKDSFAHMDGDHLQLLQVYNSYQRCKQDCIDPEKWCRQHYVNFRSLQSAESVRMQLQGIMEKMCLPIVSMGEQDPQYNANIRKSLVAGCFTNIARLQPDGKHKDMYMNMRDNQVASMHPSTCLKYRPDWVIFNDMVLTQKNYIRTCTKIQPEWLIEICADYCTGAKVSLPQSLATRELAELKGKLIAQTMGPSNQSTGMPSGSIPHMNSDTALLEMQQNQMAQQQAVLQQQQMLNQQQMMQQQQMLQQMQQQMQMQMNNFS